MQANDPISAKDLLDNMAISALGDEYSEPGAYYEAVELGDGHAIMVVRLDNGQEFEVQARQVTR